MLSLAAALTAGAAWAAADRRYAAHGVAFDYPASWKAVESERLRVDTGAQLWSQWFVPVRAQDLDLVMVSGYRLPVSITAASIRFHQPAIVASVEQLAEAGGGAVMAGPTRTTVAGLPALRFEVTARSPDGRAVRSRLTFAFRGRTEYFVNCQRARHPADVARACDTIVRSFRTT